MLDNELDELLSFGSGPCSQIVGITSAFVWAVTIRSSVGGACLSFRHGGKD